MAKREIGGWILPIPVDRLLKRLHDAGYEAYLVGGCVRDCILGRAVNDYDVATVALPEQVKACFAKEKVLETGIRHGTVTVVLEGMALEVTTYRIDGDYADGRRPDSVTFTSHLIQDLSRRDFTINAMAYHPREGLVDPFGGWADLQAKTIRCVGVPQTRFEEDALRILRALRFASQLSFALDVDTADAVHSLCGRLPCIARERVQTELVKLLVGKEAGQVLLGYSDVICTAIPQLKPSIGFAHDNPHHRYDVWTHTCQTVALCGEDPVVRLAALLHDVGKPFCFSRDENGMGHFYGHAAQSVEIASDIMKTLRFDSKTIHEVETLIRWHDVPIVPTEKSVRRWLARIGVQQLRRLLDLKKADLLATGTRRHEDPQVQQLDTIASLAEQNATTCLTLRQLHVDGNDLIRLGFLPGRLLGDTLQRLLQEVMDGDCVNKKEALCMRAQELLIEKEETI